MLKDDSIFYTADRAEWRAWLCEHFETEKEIWFVFPMKESGEASLSYNDAVEEALCFDWIDSTIKNLDLLIDILAQTYMLMFTRLSEDDLRATQQDIGLSPNSICSILHQFIEECEEELHFETPEALLKSLQINIRKKLEATDNG